MENMGKAAQGIPEHAFSALAIGSQADVPAWTAARRHIVLLVLCLVGVFNLIDRQLILILSEPIKREFHLSDTLVGLLTGLSFALVYVTAALPLARWVDSGVRRSIISICLGAWSVLTMLCGLTQSYLQLAAARMGVALGEAGATPTSQSMICDLYPLSKRATAFATLSASSSLGLGFGLLFGGLLSAHFLWRTVFIIVGSPGLLLAVLIRLTVPEPPRGMSDGVATKSAAPPLREVVSYLWSLRSFRGLALSALSCAFVNYGLQSWAPTFFVRVHGMNAKEVGLQLGVASAIGLVGGAFASGLIADRLGRKDIRWYMRVAAAGTLLAIPCVLAAIWAPTPTLAFAFYCPAIGLLSFWAAPIVTMTQTIALPRMRGLASAIVSFFLNLVGYGLGPVAVGALNDFFLPLHGNESLRYSLTALTVSAVGAAGACFCTNRWIRTDYATMQRRAAENAA
jgi:MFS family permease